MFRRVLPAILFLVSSLLYSQTYEVRLSELTTLDEDLIHVAILKDKPNKTIILRMKFQKYKFLNLDSENAVAIVQNDSADILYIDLNNDEDLTNDGLPLIFYLSQNTIWFDVYNQKDSSQKTRLVLYRRPNLPDSMQHRFIDKEGNLSKPFANIYGAQFDNNDFKGERRTFFFDDRMSLRRGILNVEN